MRQGMKQNVEQGQGRREKISGKKLTSKQAGKGLMGLGLLLLMAAIALTGYNLWDSRRADQAAADAVRRLREQITDGRQAVAESGEGSVIRGQQAAEELPLYMQYPEMEMPVMVVDGNEYIGLLTIPVLELELPVISQWSRPNLKIALCRYSGSAYLGDLIIAGHNYSGYFHDLVTLEPGDQVLFTDVDGNLFSYQVTETEVLAATAIEEMQSGDWDLTLFTCTYDTRARVAVRCQRMETGE